MAWTPGWDRHSPRFHCGSHKAVVKATIYRRADSWGQYSVFWASGRPQSLLVSPPPHQTKYAGGHAHSVLQLPASTHQKLRSLHGVAPGNGSQWPIMMVFPGYTRKHPQITVVVSGTWCPLNVSEARSASQWPLPDSHEALPRQARLVENRMSPQPEVQEGFRVASCLDLVESS